MIGVYGVATYATAQRKKEIGIGVALGANRRDVMALVLSQTLGSTFLGICIGLTVAFAATRVLAARLYGVTTLDPLTFLFAALLLVTVAIGGSYVPARRATKLDPLVALRAE